MSEVPSVTQAVESEGDDWSGSQLSDHSYMRSHQSDRNYHILQPVSHSDNAAMTLGQQNSNIITTPQVAETVEVKSSVQEEGCMSICAEDVKPELTELAIAKSSDGSNHFRTLADQDIKQEDDAYVKGMEQKDIIIALIYTLPIENVPYNVTHIDLVKALSTPTDKVSVRVMRRTLPCLRIVAYQRKAEYVGKKKIKGLWNVTPYDWPKDIPYKDPNNGEKMGDGRTVPKANSADLRAMFGFMKNKFMANIANEIDQMSKDDIQRLPRPPDLIFEEPPRRAVKRQATAAASQAVNINQEIPTFVEDEEVYQVMRVKHQHDEDEPDPEPEDEVESGRESSGGPITDESDYMDLNNEEEGEDSDMTPQENDGLIIMALEGRLCVMRDNQILAERAMPSDANDHVVHQAAYELLTGYREAQASQAGLQVVSLDDDGQVSYERAPSTQEESVISGQPLQRQDTQSTPGHMTPVVAAASTKPRPSATPKAMPRLPKTPMSVPVQRQDSNASTGPQTPLTVQAQESPVVKAHRIATMPQQPSTMNAPKPTKQPLPPVNTYQNPKPTNSIHHHHSLPTYAANLNASKSSQPPVPDSPYMEVVPVKTDQPSKGVYGQSMFSVMQNQQIFQAPGARQCDMRTTILTDLYQRLKEKIMYLQNITLGDEKISASLSRLYQTVIMQHFARAQMDPTKTEAFIHAAHRCESLMDKAMLDGKNLPRNIFLEDCKKITEECGNPMDPAKVQQYVFNADMPEHPPVQANSLMDYLKDINNQFSSSNPAALLPPKSPGTALGEKLGDLHLQSPSDSRDFESSVSPMTDVSDLAHFGIKQKKEGSLNNVFEARTFVKQPEETESKDDKQLIMMHPAVWEQSMLALIKGTGVTFDEGDDKKTKSEQIAAKILSPDVGAILKPGFLTENDPLMSQVGMYKETTAPGLRLAPPECAMPQREPVDQNAKLDLEEVLDMQDDYVTNETRKSQGSMQPAAEEGSAVYHDTDTRYAASMRAMNPVTNPNSTNHVANSRGFTVAMTTPTPPSTYRPGLNSHVGKAKNKQLRQHGTGPSYMKRGKDVRWTQSPKQTIGKTVNAAQGRTDGGQRACVETTVAPLPSMSEVMMNYEEHKMGVTENTFNQIYKPPEK